MLLAAACAELFKKEAQVGGGQQVSCWEACWEAPRLKAAPAAHRCLGSGLQPDPAPACPRSPPPPPPPPPRCTRRCWCRTSRARAPSRRPPCTRPTAPRCCPGSSAVRAAGARPPLPCCTGRAERARGWNQSRGREAHLPLRWRLADAPPTPHPPRPAVNGLTKSTLEAIRASLALEEVLLEAAGTEDAPPPWGTMERLSPLLYTWAQARGLRVLPPCWRCCWEAGERRCSRPPTRRGSVPRAAAAPPSGPVRRARSACWVGGWTASWAPRTGPACPSSARTARGAWAGGAGRAGRWRARAVLGST